MSTHRADRVVQAVDAAARALDAALTCTPRVALVLGSGLAQLADGLTGARSVPFSAIPGMGDTSVAGHPGRFVAGELGGVPVVVMQGRLHPYEGHGLSTVVLGVRSMVRLGARTLLVTNAAGGLRPELGGGSLLAITDHLNLTGKNCLVGPNDAELGPRFPDMSEAYAPELRALAHDEARALGLTLHEGVYAGVLGPSYETPAEVRMLALLGASAVGMSTVQEVIAARHMGARVLGISCITNLGAGLSSAPLSHVEVESVARRMTDDLTRLVTRIVTRIGAD
jgi:purine-nucleoside phosphorylase